MKIRLISLLFVLGVLFVPSLSSADRVLIVGDSHSSALGPLLVAEFEARDHAADYVQHNGWSSRSYRNHGNISAGDIDLAVVILGGNNRHRTLEDYRTDFSWVYHRLRMAGAQQVVWFGPLWCTPRRVQRRHNVTRRLQAELAQEFGITWFDLYRSTRPYRLAPDGVHFTYSSYRRMVRNVFVPLLFP